MRERPLQNLKVKQNNNKLVLTKKKQWRTIKGLPQRLADVIRIGGCTTINQYQA